MLFFTDNQIHSCTTTNRTVAENSVKYVPPDGFLGIRRHSDLSKSSFGRGCVQTPLKKLLTLPRPPSRLGRGCPLPILLSLDAFGSAPVSGLWPRHFSKYAAALAVALPVATSGIRYAVVDF